MTWVAAAAGTVALGTSAYKIGAGGRQAKKGRELERNNVRPVYTRPGEVTQSLNLAERNYTNGMPGADLAESRLGTNAATAFDTATAGATSSADILDAATRINVGTNSASNDLNLQKQNYKAGAMNNYIAQLMTNAQYGDKEFDYNQNQPFQETAAKAASMIGAGNQNVFSGINEVGGLATNVLMSSMSDGQSTPATMGEKKGAIQPVNNSLQPITQAPQIPTANPMNGKMVFDPATGKYTMKFL